MEEEDDDVIESELVGRTARLPGGSRVVITKVYSDGEALLERIDGEFAGDIVLCAIARLEIEPKAGSSSETQPPTKPD